MSHLSQLKTKWGYDRSTPRCAICVSYQKPRTHHEGGRQRGTPPMCQAGSFEVRPAGCCDRWQGKSGERLEKAG